jgi:hypothetical protein
MPYKIHICKQISILLLKAWVDVAAGSACPAWLVSLVMCSHRQ